MRYLVDKCIDVKETWANIDFNFWRSRIHYIYTWLEDVTFGWDASVFMDGGNSNEKKLHNRYFGGSLWQRLHMCADWLIKRRKTVSGHLILVPQHKCLIRCKWSMENAHGWACWERSTGWELHRSLLVHLNVVIITDSLREEWLYEVRERSSQVLLTQLYSNTQSSSRSRKGCR